MTKKEILTNAAAMFFAMCIPFVVAVLGCRGEAWHVVAENLNSAVATDLGIYIIVSMIGGCWIFNNMKTKEQRITFKMLPATDAEKFAVRVLYVTLVWWLMGIVAFCAADVFRMLVSLIVGTDVVRSTIPDFLSMLFGIGGNDHVVVNYRGIVEALPFIVMLYAWVFWVHSLYILGGAFFRRRQFVLTTVVHFVLRRFPGRVRPRYGGTLGYHMGMAHCGGAVCLGRARLVAVLQNLPPYAGGEQQMGEPLKGKKVKK